MNEVLKDGALMGVLMSASTMFETYVIYYSDFALTKAAICYFVEWVVLSIIYVWLLYRFCRKYSVNNFDSSVGFDFGQGFGFVITLTLFVAIMVGVTTTIFQSVMGFDEFINGYIARVDELVAYMGANNIAMNSMEEPLAELRDNIRAFTQPSMLENIFAAIYSYVFTGIFIGLIIAAALRRKPVIVERNENEE